MQKTYQIRYNNLSDDESNRWRLISDGEEILVQEIYVNSMAYTTKDLVSKINGTDNYKYHLTCRGHLSLKNGVAFISRSDNKSATKRHLLKTISYRLMATTVTIGTAFVLGIDLKISALLGVGELVIKPIFYYLHERFWYKLRLNFKYSYVGKK
jgi:uncharacterized membrane protein